ncbi:ABC transporter ATP-binding protein [Hypericibacter adhaerens]|uniref:ABC transporter ATP-binding protein n=1 Tax=Hypericibacter adhaerens TaxID=2602016 RepID=A0A5J6MVV3_9PROT|nr:ABC transporter ATP-binding protein [Hypericibacter adhaerens]QEX21253.1 ABC transporter ATP-binding protein [Hypericibacter adhaerens]
MSLTISGLTAGYTREVPILSGVNLRAEEGMVTTIIGPNGAGKSTLLRAVFGYLKPASGTVEHFGRTVTGLEPEQMLTEGVAYLIQGRSVFPSMTVAENLELGCWTIRRDRRRVLDALARAYEQYPRMAEKRNARAGSLSGGEQRMLEIARITMTNPRTLLLDEPSVGLMPSLVEEVYQQIGALKKAGYLILLVDQNIRKTLQIADYVYVLKMGANSHHGPAAEFKHRLADIIKEWI